MNEYLPGLEGVPATKSNISDLDGMKGVLTYRSNRPVKYNIREIMKYLPATATQWRCCRPRWPVWPCSTRAKIA